MSQRIALTAASCVVLIAGCSAGDRSSAPAAKKVEAKDGTNYTACRDGTCQVEIRKRATLPLDAKKFDVAALAVTVADDTATIRFNYTDGGHGEVSVGGNAVTGTNGFFFSTPWSDGDIAVLDVSYPSSG